MADPATPPTNPGTKGWVFPRPAPLWRFLKDPQAALWKKGIVVATVAYVFWPADAVLDTLPFIGWLDDIGVVGLAIAYMGRVLGDYSSAKSLGSEPAQPPRDQSDPGESRKTMPPRDIGP